MQKDCINLHFLRGTLSKNTETILIWLKKKKKKQWVEVPPEVVTQPFLFVRIKIYKIICPAVRGLWADLLNCGARKTKASFELGRRGEELSFLGSESCPSSWRPFRREMWSRPWGREASVPGLSLRRTQDTDFSGHLSPFDAFPWSGILGSSQ